MRDQYKICIYSSSFFYYILPLNLAMKGWLSIADAVGLFEGFIWKILLKRSSKCSSEVLRMFFSVFFCLIMIDFALTIDDYFYKNCRSSYYGIPVTQNIFWSCDKLELPWKIGFSIIISANRHPKLQISIGLPYLQDPRRTSGARYQRVAMCYVS